MSLLLVLASASLRGAEVDAAALAALERRAQESNSATLVVLHDGRTVLDRTFIAKRLPIEAMSATKSIVGLAVGFLVDDGALTLDTPVAKFFPEWKEGPKSSITVRHLLEQSSGLEAPRTTETIYSSPDFVRQALDASLATPPGSAFFYNNKATNLVPGLVEKASGQKLDAFLDKRLFRPLGIREWTWSKDKAGNPHGMSGLQIRAEDLAKIGQLMLDGGKWEGKRILSEDWMRESSRSAALQPNVAGLEYGRLWWRTMKGGGFLVDGELIDRWKKADADPDAIALLERVEGQVFPGLQPFWEKMTEGLPIEERLAKARRVLDEAKAKGLPAYRQAPGEMDGFAAMGDLGQWLLILPSRRLVVVRQRLAPSNMAEWNDAKLMMRDLVDLARALTP